MEYRNKILNGNCLEVLKKLPEHCVDMIVTSPPYYGLRDYGEIAQIGQEDTPEEYIEKLTEVFMEVHRVLKANGTLWLNIGDSYVGSRKGVSCHPENDMKYKQGSNRGALGSLSIARKFSEYKPKDLLGIPWMLAFSLRSKGWYLRQDIIWAKPNPMPECVKDRCTKSHEYIFLFSKQKKYYFDHEAIFEPAAYDGRRDTICKGGEKYSVTTNTVSAQSFAGRQHERWPNSIRGFVTKEEKTGLSPNRHGGNIPTQPARNKRDVWTVSTAPFKGAHFATFPEKLIAPCIMAGCPEDGIVLDPFMGSGTTAIVAKKLNRHFTGIELNSDYIEIANKRLFKEFGLFL